MQQRCGEAEYAVGRFVLEHAGALRLSRSGVGAKAHYRDVNAGHRALAKLLMMRSLRLLSR